MLQSIMEAVDSTAVTIRSPAVRNVNNVFCTAYKTKCNIQYIKYYLDNLCCKYGIYNNDIDSNR